MLSVEIGKGMEVARRCEGIVLAPQDFGGWFYSSELLIGMGLTL